MKGKVNNTDRWLRYFDRHAKTCDREMGFFDRFLFADSRDWVCRQTVGDVLEVAIGTGLNLLYYPPSVRLSAYRIRVGPASVQPRWSPTAYTPEPTASRRSPS
jgi:hypothetical protein